MIITGPHQGSASDYIDLLLGDQLSKEGARKFVKYITNVKTSLNFLKPRHVRQSGYSLKFQRAIVRSLKKGIEGGGITVQKESDRAKIIALLGKVEQKVEGEITNITRGRLSISKITKMNGCDDWQTQRLLSTKSSRGIFSLAGKGRYSWNSAQVNNKWVSKFKYSYDQCCTKKLNTHEMLTYMARNGFSIDIDTLIVRDTRESIRSYGEIKCLTDSTPDIVIKVNHAIAFAQKYNMSVADTISVIKSHVPEHDVVFVEGNYNALYSPGDGQQFIKPCCFFDVTKKKDAESTRL